MKTIKIANKEYIFVEVPDRTYDFSNELHSAQIDYVQDNPWKNGVIKSKSAIIITEFYNDNFEIITTTNSITEEIAKTLIPSKKTLAGVIYPHYPLLEDFSSYYNEEHWASICDTALDSFYSLMDSLELDRSKNYLLIEKL